MALNPKEIISSIYERRNILKKNTFILIVGESGEGKSYAALRIAEFIDSQFDPSQQVIYTAADLLKKIEEAREKKYKVLILDEAHTTIPARLWYSITNIATTFILTTFRQLQRLCLIFVSPSIEEVDVSIRRSVNFYFIVKRTTNEFSYVFPYQVVINRFDLEKQKVRLKRLTIKHNRKIYIIKEFLLKKPSKENIEKYENAAVKYKADLLRRQLNEIQSKVGSTLENKKTFDEIMAFLFENKKMLNMSFRKRKDGSIKLKRDFFKRLFKLTEQEIFELEAILFEELKKQNLI